MSEREKFACEVCGVSSHDKPTFRVNPKGEPGIFRCEGCLGASPDPAVKGVVEAVDRILAHAHPEDAPEGPWTACSASQAPHIWAVLIPHGRWAFTGNEREAIAVRDALNRLKGEKADGLQR